MDPRLGELKKFYELVYKKEDSFVALHRDPVGLFLKAYKAEPQRGMFNVYNTIDKMHELF